jgi:hypothetical protein
MIGLCVIAELKPTLYGFDVDPLPRTHYYEDRPKEWDDVNHNPSIEQKMLSRLDKAEKLILK